MRRPHFTRRLIILLLLSVLATACNEGRVNVYAFADSHFSPWYSTDEHWEFMNEHYDSMVVWAPYWDSRLADYDRVTFYRNAYSIKVDASKDARAADHPDWVLREADGSPVYIPFRCAHGCPQYAADLGNPAFVADWIASVRTRVDDGYTGLFIDDVNLAWRFSDQYGGEATPIDPRTGEPLTLTDWRRYMVDFLEQVRAAFPDLRIWHNSIWYVDTPDFDDPYLHRQIQAADVVHLQRGVTDRGLTSGTGRFALETYFQFIDLVHSLGRNVAVKDEHAVDDRGQWYSIAGYLMINDGDDLLTTNELDYIAPTDFFEGFATDLGHATGPREFVDGIHRREFSNGLVVMNGPRSSTTPVDLGGSWRRPDGALVTSVTLDRAEAMVLTKP